MNRFELKIDEWKVRPKCHETEVETSNAYVLENIMRIEELRKKQKKYKEMQLLSAIHSQH